MFIIARHYRRSVCFAALLLLDFHLICPNAAGLLGALELCARNLAPYTADCAMPTPGSREPERTWKVSAAKKSYQKSFYRKLYQRYADVVGKLNRSDLLSRIV